VADFMNSTAYGGASFSPDGSKLLVSHNGSGVFNAYAIPVAGGEPEALTHSTTDAVFAISYFDDDERFLYTADQGGNELSHLYVRETDGTATDLTPGEGHRAQFAGWSDDRTEFYVGSNERDPRFFDVYRYSASPPYERTLIYRNEAGYFPGPVSPDGRRIALVAARTTNDSDVYLHDLQTGATTHITPHEGDVSSAPTGFTPDGAALLYATNEDGEFSRIMRYDLASGEKTVFAEAPWDVMFAGFSRGDSYLVVGINNDARTELRVFRWPGMATVELPAIADASVTSVAFSKDDRTMAIYAGGSRIPSDIFVQSMDGGQPRRLTSSLNPAIDPDDLVEAEVVRFSSYDGLEIPGVLYRPHEASPSNPVPALVWVHGGPGGQSRATYSGLIQALVNHGYAVYAINNRGSSGYGKSFYAMDDRKHGEADLGDVVASKEMLIETGWVDPARIGIIGGSYGGYMVLAALAFQPDVFDVGVDIFGVSNWIRTLESIPPWWEAQREALYAEMGDPATDRERLERITPLFHAANIQAPLMVLQGANDPRVLQVESDEIVEAVRANGVPVEYVVFPDEGHGFRNKENEIAGYGAILDFLETHLKGTGGVS
jgi:dipeptidyl aminopeptidase/acylaminoacyl peptidase